MLTRVLLVTLLVSASALRLQTQSGSLEVWDAKQREVWGAEGLAVWKFGEKASAAAEGGASQSLTEKSVVLNQTAQIVYVNAFGRSMSSTIQKFLGTLNPSTFSLFEPCHKKDITSYGNLADENTNARCVSDVLSGDFSKISKLFHTPNFFQSSTQKRLQASSTLNIKTIWLHNLTNVITLLDSHPHTMKVVHILRDPRSILASQKTTWKSVITEHDVGNMCRFQAYNLDVTHPKIHKVHFHDVASDPMFALKKLTEDMGNTFATPQVNFVSTNFNNPHCKEEDYSSCKKKSKGTVRKWEKHLNAKEEQLITNNAECMKVIGAYYADVDYASF